ncbi:MAG: efflux RND transporter permease subunit, partial [Proteobacteria bacterium]|nr:efflux RND transporter permease subunit [Pseudomonadota bacterium]
MTQASNREAGSIRRGLVGVFSAHPTAANLLMVIMIILGGVSLSRMNTQLMPDFGIDWVRVSVGWSGASADDVDANIVQALEPELRYLDGVHKVASVSVEGVASISVEVET